MALTQTRMIAVLTAGTDFQQAYRQVMEDIWQLLQRAERGDTQATTQGALEALFWAAKGACKKPEHHAAVLQVEREHFRKNAKRNDYSARRHERLRREAGVPPRKNLGPTFGQIAESRINNHPAPEAIPQVDMGFYTKMMEEELAQQAQSRAPQGAHHRPAPAPPEFHDNLTRQEALAINRAQLQQEAQEEAGGLGLDLEEEEDDDNT